MNQSSCYLRPNPLSELFLGTRAARGIDIYIAITHSVAIFDFSDGSMVKQKIEHPEEQKS